MRIKKLVTTSSPGHDARRRRDGAAAPRDAAFYAHIRHEARFYGPARRVVAAQELHLLLVGAHGRRDLLTEGGHGSLVSRCAAVQKSVARCRSQLLRGAATASSWAGCSCYSQLCQAYYNVSCHSVRVASRLEASPTDALLQVSKPLRSVRDATITNQTSRAPAATEWIAAIVQQMRAAMRP